MVALFGGAFDPPHNGHVALVEAALEHFQPERLLVFPTGFAPHKPVETSPVIRLRLAEAAFIDFDRVLVSDYEIVRDEPSFTLATTLWAQQLYGDVMFLVGADQFASFDSWHRPNEVLRAARLGVATRPGYREQDLRRQLEKVEDPSRVEFFEIPPTPVSSTEVRSSIARGEDISGLVPLKVSELVGELDLYRR
jgi:nicotinate-nucleotide adenylyltransferase